MSLPMFLPAGDFLLTAGLDNYCRFYGVWLIVPKFHEMRFNFPTFFTVLCRGLFDIENV